MEQSPTFCLKNIIRLRLPLRGSLLLSLFIKSFIACYLLLFISCSNQGTYYKKKVAPLDAKVAAIQIQNGSRQYYQGSVPEQILLDKAMELDPKKAEAWRERSVAYLKRGFAAEYYPYFQKAIELDPLAWQGYRGYNYLYFYRDYERALADFKATDFLTPDIVDYPQAISVYYMRAICYLKMDDYDTAIKYLDRHIEEELSNGEEKYIDPKTFLFKGIAYHHLGQYEDAANSYRRALQHAPENADLWYWLAKAGLAAGDIPAAKVALDKANTQFKKGYFNQRNYVAEFFQIYQEDIDELRLEMNAI